MQFATRSPERSPSSPEPAPASTRRRPSCWRWPGPASRSCEAVELLADLAAPGELEAAIRGGVEKLGALDIVVANAGINGIQAPIEEVGVDEWDRTLNLNLRGTS